jgi:6-phosphogluconolactonase
MLLGIGDDGHTASLFPGNDAVKDRTHLARAVFLDDMRHHRITLTLPVLNNARNSIFLATGKEKTDILRRILSERDESLPATLVKPKGNLLFFLDSEAAAGLESQGPGEGDHPGGSA